MIQRFTYTQLIITGTTVASGLMFGLFLFSRNKKYRTSVVNHATEIADWVDTKGRHMLSRNPSHLQHFRGSVQKRLKRHIPDLYEATEYLSLNEPYVAGA